ncbi:MAG: UDP-2,3-diacylglucosamine diphosphatase [Bacteroidetes bacterium]|nr:UDP-2,3-diacylglucosamine diphosphatase [Bacteroidota bacterium]
MENKQKIYFISDSHLGVPDYESSLKREKLMVKWLDEVKKDATEIYLLGDIFDFWFEYKTVVPKGYVRLLGKLAEISDAGIKLNYFTGNHDMWIYDYFHKELNANIYKEPIQQTYGNFKFYIGHGDGLGPDDHGYKFIKKIFSNRFNQWLFARLHPNFGIGLALYFSRKSRIANGNTDEIFLGEDKERLIVYAKEILQKEHFDFFIFGHRHLPLDIKIAENSRYLNIGDWVKSFSYIVFDGEKLDLKFFC